MICGVLGCVLHARFDMEGAIRVTLPAVSLKVSSALKSYFLHMLSYGYLTINCALSLSVMSIWV